MLDYLATIADKAYQTSGDLQMLTCIKYKHVIITAGCRFRVPRKQLFFKRGKRLNICGHGI
jgi:hypothetical protein